MSTRDVLARLQGVKRSGDGWEARCPAHDDQRASLSIHEAPDGKTLLHCHAGCEVDAIAGAIGLATSDLFLDRPYPAGSGKPSIAAAYDYTDEKGTLLYQVVRFLPKDFRQRRPDGNGGWTWKLGDVQRVPYRLPQLMKAVQARHTVFIVEGEKDVEGLQALGLTATCNAGGAGKWHPELSEALRGARVVILPDNDEPGRKHARDVATRLHGIASEVRIVELPDLPPKGDVSDWLLAGGTVAQLEARVKGTPPWTPEERPETKNDALEAPGGVQARVTCLADVEPEEVQWLWYPYIPLRKLTLLEGDPGDGKTFLALTLTAALTRGDPLPGESSRREVGSVLYWTAEDGLADTLRPRLDAAGADPRRVFALAPDTETGGFLTIDCTAEIEAALDEVRPCLLVIDPIQAALGSDVDAHRANEVRPRLSRLMRWAEKYECAVVVIRHLSKAPALKAIHRGLGSIDFSAAARSVLLVGRHPEDPERRALVQTKNNVAPFGPPREFLIGQQGVEWHAGPSSLTAASLLAPEQSKEDRTALDEAMEFLRDALTGAGGVAVKEVQRQARRAGIAERTLRRAKDALGVNSKKSARSGEWSWYLPVRGPSAPSTTDGHVGHVEQDEAVQEVREDGQDGHDWFAWDVGLVAPEPGEEAPWTGRLP